MFNEQWWNTKDAPHGALSKLIEGLYTSQDRDAQYRQWIQAYLGNTSDAWNWSMMDNAAGSTRNGYNLIRSCVDTVVNRIGKMNTTPSFVTNDGSWGMRKKVEKLDAYVKTQLKSHRFQAVKREAFRDCATFGDGFIKFYGQGDNVFFERCFPLEIMVDRTEGIYGSVDKLYHVKGVTRSKAMAMFTEKKDLLAVAPGVPDSRRYWHHSTSDIIEVYEAWMLPYWELRNGKIEIIEAGRHVIATKNATLLDEGWDMLRFPFIHFQWLSRPLGFFGTGIAEQIFGAHTEVNKLIDDIRQNMYWNSAPFWWLEQGGEVLKSRITNEIGRIIEGLKKPELISFATTQPEIFNHLQWLISSAMNEVGISQLAAQSQKPQGLDSGKALREFDDIESERFVTVGQHIEEQIIEGAHIIIDVTKQTYKENSKLSVRFKEKNLVREIPWKDIDLEVSKDSIEILPRSALSNTFSGRIQDAKDLLELGIIDNATTADLFDFPDIKGATTLSQAARNYVKEAFDKILDEEKYITPVPSMDLKFAVKYSTLMTDKLLCEGFDEEKKLGLMRSFTAQAQDLLDQMQQAQMPVAQGQPLPQAANTVTGQGDLAPVMGNMPPPA